MHDVMYNCGWVPEFAQFLTEEMRGGPYDLAIDRARRIVNERRFALGVQQLAGADHAPDYITRLRA